MCGISGYINFKDNFILDVQKHRRIAHEITRTLRHRGPDSFGEWIGEHAAFGHSHLAKSDPIGNIQPMERTVAGYQFVITYDGALYNAQELKNTLVQYGYRFTTTSDTEILLYSYIHFGADCVEKLNGIYSFCIWDSMRQRVFICRDRFGIKPLFYALCDDTLIFGSEQKAILAYPGFKAEVSKEGLCEILAMSPAITHGIGVFEKIHELKPGRFMTITRDSIKTKQYFYLKAKEHTDSYEDTLEKTKELIEDSIKRQLSTDVPAAAVMSGDIDSGIISAISADEFAKKGKRLCTYSLDYKDSDKYFRTPTFRPDSDAPGVKHIADRLGTFHSYLLCDNDIMLDYIYECVDAKDLPGIPDKDAALLFFSRMAKKQHTVILSGLCSDEIFGGTNQFSQKYSGELRKTVLLPEVEKTLEIDSYLSARYKETVAETPKLESDSLQDTHIREISWLNLNMFMPGLLNSADRIGMSNGLEIRMPFCDHRIIEYVYNVPLSIKNKGNIPKNLLHSSAKGMLPEDVFIHKNSTYTKACNPGYEQMVKQLILDTIQNPNEPILALCDRNIIENMCIKKAEYDHFFTNQIMDYSQFLGFLLQVNYWLKHYRIRIV